MMSDDMVKTTVTLSLESIEALDIILLQQRRVSKRKPTRSETIQGLIYEFIENPRLQKKVLATLTVQGPANGC